MEAAKEGPVVDHPPREHAPEPIWPRPLGYAHSGLVELESGARPAGMGSDEAEVSPGIHASKVGGDQVLDDPDSVTVMASSMQFRRVDDRVVVPVIRAHTRRQLFHLEALLSPSTVHFLVHGMQRITRSALAGFEQEQAGWFGLPRSLPSR